MTDAEILSYLGKPWTEGAEGPDAFDCWGLLRWVLEHHYGQHVPRLPLGEPEAIMRAVRERLATGEWVPMQMPCDGCGALLRGGTEPHVGVWLANDGGGVLHSMRGTGVVFSRERDLRNLMFPRVKYYKRA